MKKLIIILGVVLLFVFSTGSVLAKRTEKFLPTEVATPQTKRVEVKARITEKRRALIQAFFERMIRRFEAAASRLDKLISRIESRLAKIEAEGENVASIRSELARAKANLNEAQANLIAAQTVIAQMLSSDDPKSAFANVRANIKEIKIKLVEVHRILVHLIGNIQGLHVGATK